MLPMRRDLNPVPARGTWAAVFSLLDMPTAAATGRLLGVDGRWLVDDLLWPTGSSLTVTRLRHWSHAAAVATAHRCQQDWATTDAALVAGPFMLPAGTLVPKAPDRACDRRRQAVTAAFHDAAATVMAAAGSGPDLWVLGPVTGELVLGDCGLRERLLATATATNHTGLLAVRLPATTAATATTLCQAVTRVGAADDARTQATAQVALALADDEAQTLTSLDALVTAAAAVV